MPRPPLHTQRRSQVRGKDHPRTGHEGPKGEYSYSSTLSLTSAANWGGWSTPRPISIVQEVGWDSEPVRTGEENLAPTGIESRRGGVASRHTAEPFWPHEVPQKPFQDIQETFKSSLKQKV